MNGKLLGLADSYQEPSRDVSMEGVESGLADMLPMSLNNLAYPTMIYSMKQACSEALTRTHCSRYGIRRLQDSPGITP